MEEMKALCSKEGYSATLAKLNGPERSALVPLPGQEKAQRPLYMAVYRTEDVAQVYYVMAKVSCVETRIEKLEPKFYSHGGINKYTLMHQAAKQKNFAAIAKLQGLYQDVKERPTSDDPSTWPICGACTCAICQADPPSSSSSDSPPKSRKRKTAPLDTDAPAEHKRCFGCGYLWLGSDTGCNLSHTGIDLKAPRLVLKPALESVAGPEAKTPLHCLLDNRVTSEKDIVNAMDCILALVRRDPRLLYTVWIPPSPLKKGETPQSVAVTPWQLAEKNGWPTIIRDFLAIAQQ